MTEGQPSCAYEGCNRAPHKTSSDGRCIFHAKAEDKTVEDFSQALKKYLSKLKQAKDAVYDFVGFIFPGDIDFSEDFGLEVFKRVDFSHATFQGEARFWNATFQGDAWFWNATFQGEARFGDAIFKYIEFDDTRFRETASISPRSIGVGVSFSNATIENIVISPLHLEEEAQIDFSGARLRNTNISREDVEGYIKQEKSKNYRAARDIYMLLKNNFHTIGRYDDESWAFLQEKEMERKHFWCPIKELQIKELGEKWKNKGLKDCFYPTIFYSGRIAKYLWDFWLPTSWKNTKELAFRRTKSFRHPSVCVRVEFKNLVSSMTMNEEEKSRRKVDLSWKEILKALLFYLQSLRYKSARKYFKSTFLKWLYGWGEKPWRIFIWCGFTIFIFSILYCFIGDIAVNADIIKSYGTKLYFSGITFTTLGFGGYSPMGGAKVLAFIESFLGIFSIALFVYSFARRTAGR